MCQTKALSRSIWRKGVTVRLQRPTPIVIGDTIYEDDMDYACSTHKKTDVICA